MRWGGELYGRGTVREICPRGEMSYTRAKKNKAEAKRQRCQRRRVHSVQPTRQPHGGGGWHRRSTRRCGVEYVVIVATVSGESSTPRSHPRQKFPNCVMLR